MKRILLVLFVIAVLANLAFAGDDSIPKSRSGDKAWLFTLSGLSNLGAGSYMGGVGGKYYISDGNALRLSLGFATSTTTTKPPANAPANSPDQKASATTFIFAPGFLHNINANGPVLAYVGGEFIIATNSTTTENPNFVNNNKDHVSTTAFGVAGIAGVEWFAWNNISLAAEYLLMYTSSSGTTETTINGTTTSRDNPSTTNFSVGATSILPTINFTLSVFW